MNILQAEDLIKGLPDQALMQEAQAPSGQVPQYLVVSEIQRRSDMRKRYQEQQQPQGTVADQIVQEAAGGIASMPPQGMPPQGMPPQGAPQQAMPPQAMPPQQMFSGGIIRLQEGGFLDQMTVAPELSGRQEPISVRDQIKVAIAEGATMADLLAIFRNQPEAIELVKQLVADRQRASVSQYNPLFDEGVSDLDKAFIASDRAKDVVADQIGSRFNYFQPPEIVGDVVEGAVNAYRSIPSMDDLVSSARDALPAPPSREAVQSAGRQAGEGFVGFMRDMLPEAPERGQVPDLAGRYAEQVASIKESLPSLPDLGQTDVALPARSRGEGIASARESYVPDSVSKGLGSAFDAIFGVPERPDYEVAGEVATVRPFDQDLTDQFMDAYQRAAEAKPGQVDAPEALKDALELAQEGTQDSSGKGVGTLYDEGGIERLLRGSGAKNVQGDSPIQTQGLSGDKTEPSLDFADLVADAKKAGMANALMQLGAGIAGGDLSKGISAAGIAATKGQQAAKDLAIKQRLATYAAGREDQAREEKAEEFKKTFGLSEKKVNALIEQNADTTQREILRTLVSLYEGESSPDKRANYARQIQNMLKEIQGLPVEYGVNTGLSGKDLSGLTEFQR